MLEWAHKHCLIYMHHNDKEILICFLENVPRGSDVATACGRPVFELPRSSDEPHVYHLPKTFKHYMFYYACHPGSFINM